MNQDKRLDKIVQELTPKQAVVHWLQEIQDYRNPREYVLYLRGLPESEAPIYRLTEQITKSLRRSMRGSSQDFVDRTVRRAVKDVVFLVKLHLSVNFEIMKKLREWRLSQIALAEGLNKLNVEILLRQHIVEIADQVNFQTPYPLDLDTAAIVDSAIRHHVHSFEAITEEGYIQDWLWEYLIAQGAKELPLTASQFKDGKKHPNITPENEAEIRACFQDEAQFELFRSGQDYTCDLASVTDSEYYQHYETIVNGLKVVVESGQVQAGWILYLEMVPLPFLKDIPLVEGVWLDRQALELAEWGTLLQASGYQFKDEENQPRLASATIIGEDGKEGSLEEVWSLRQKAARNLLKFPGRTREIDNRLYLHFEDYRTWRGRKIKGDLRQCVQQGLLTSSWNQWISKYGGKDEASVAGIPIGQLHCYVNEIDYYSCPPGVEEPLRQRESLLEDIRYWGTKTDWKQETIRDWKLATHTVLVELLAYQKAITSIQNSYFEGCPVLFSDVVKDLADIISHAEGMVDSFNEFFAHTMEISDRVDLEALRQNASKEANRVMAYIVDMAKAEALDCLGDSEAGVKLAERYL